MSFTLKQIAWGAALVIVFNTCLFIQQMRLQKKAYSRSLELLEQEQKNRMDRVKAILNGITKEPK